ncbi:dihydrolipoyl dehydrogenase family protein [Pelagibaculum spongiae]|uniref:dihydrolipoyl dehydrogenase family protein n=1 Tax=Pelagibaculum spongiae TaxID=2080658 RepID=UPI0026C868E9
MKNYTKPKKFDRNIIAIGAGSAGLVTSYIAAAVKAKVTLIEKNKMGGDCLNTGCVPSKALIRSAKMVSHAKRCQEFGIEACDVKVDFAKVMDRVQAVVKEIEPHDSVERYTELGVECIQGEAKLISPWEVEVNGQVLSARAIVIATGGRPFVPPIPGLQESGVLTSDNIWDLRVQPKRLAVLGGGPIGCELAQSFQRLGTQVIQIELDSRLMPREDEDASSYVMSSMRKDGVDLRLGHKAVKVSVEDGKKRITCEHNGQLVEIVCDEILCAVGRKARLQGFGLDDLAVKTTKWGTIEVNEFLQTNYPSIYACGDVAGPYQFTHTAAHQAWYAAVNGLFDGFKKFKVDYSVIPWCTFTDPEVARVGLNEQEARDKGIAFEVSSFDLEELDRAIADSENHGFVKVLTVPGKDKILGVTITGNHAGDLIAEYVLAMKHGIGMNKILGTIHIYPTMAEANKYVAGEWKRANAPQGLLKWVEKFHNWRRG